jgi:hypothetical protein
MTKNKYKTVSLGDILDFAETEQARALYKRYHEIKADHYDIAHGVSFNDLLIDQIIAPIMPRINMVTGQENDSRYIAYMVEYWLNQERVRG